MCLPNLAIYSPQCAEDLRTNAYFAVALYATLCGKIDGDVR